MTSGRRSGENSPHIYETSLREFWESFRALALQNSHSDVIKHGLFVPSVLITLHALALRAMALAYADLPRYLLAPEIAPLLHYVADWSQHALVNTLWNSGGRINEVLAHFRLNEAIPHVVIRTAMQRRAAGSV